MERNRSSYMQELENLLSDLPPLERQEALQYYTDYFEDAGSENEEEVIAALGNPPQVAAQIHLEIEKERQSQNFVPQASDRAVIEYGGGADSVDGGFTGGGGEEGAGGMGGAGSTSSESGSEKQGTEKQGTAGESTVSNIWSGIKDAYRRLEDAVRSPYIAILIVIALALVILPVIGGLASGIIGGGIGLIAAFIALVLVWYLLIVIFAIMAIVLSLVGILLFIGGSITMSTTWVGGLRVLAGGLFCCGLACLFWVLTIQLGWRATPAILRSLKKGCRAIQSMFRGIIGKDISNEQTEGSYHA
ncbi:MAG: DUF1700 domain-containing protein [Clostridium sp.]|jgi:hypothetical protein|nr:DUF1700 domain-containing protein [Clostridium sp.]